MIKIGEINYLNVYPIYYFLKKERLRNKNGFCFLEFILGTPVFLNQALQNGYIDISPSSSFYYALNYDNSVLFKNISISSKKKVRSILLFSPKSIDEFSGNETIYITPETMTSINLLKVLLTEKYKFDIKNINFIIMPSDADFRLKAGTGLGSGKISLHIGDNALKFENDNIHAGYFSYDLADLWYEFTGFPFVFALFIIRKDSYEKNKDEFKILYEYLIKAKDKAVLNFKEVLKPVMADNFYNFITGEELLDYWTSCLSFDLGENEINGYKLYCEFLYKNKIIPVVPSFNFIL